MRTRSREYISNNMNTKKFKTGIPMLPHALYGEIASFLDLRLNEFDDDYIEGDMMNFCIAVGKEAANVIRLCYLYDNEDYLLSAIVHQDNRDQMKHWMDANPQWKVLCESATSLKMSKTITISKKNPPIFSIVSSSETMAYAEYEDDSKTTVKCRIDGAVDIRTSYFTCGGYYADPETAENRIRNDLKSKDVNLSYIDAYDLFSDPEAAVDFDLSPVLKNMIECGYLNVNDTLKLRLLSIEMSLISKADRRACRRGDLSADDLLGIELPLIAHTIRMMADSCFDYLMSLPDLQCDAEFTCPWSKCKTNIIFHIISRAKAKLHPKISKDTTKAEAILSELALFATKTPNRLEAILTHPNAPDVNARNHEGFTALQLICQRYRTFNAETLQILLENGAAKKKEIILSCIRHLRKVRRKNKDGSQLEQLNEMILVFSTHLWKDIESI